MKKFVILLPLVFSLSLQAKNLEQALNEEAQIIDAQIKQLKESKIELAKRQNADLKFLQDTYIKEQRTLLSLQSEAQKKADELQTLKSDASNLAKMKERVDSSWERLFKIWKDKESFYTLNSGVKEDQSWTKFLDKNETLATVQKEEVLTGIFGYLTYAQSTRTLKANYLDDENLNSADVVRVGSIGAQLLESKLPLAPLEDGVLAKKFENTQFGSQGIFVFRDLNKVSVQAHANMWEQFVFKLPALFLILLFGIVFVLFGLFVKE